MPRVTQGFKPAPLKCGRRYPWRRWLSKDRFVLRKGLDYAVRTDSIVQMLRVKARALGVEVRTSRTEDEQSVLVIVSARPEGWTNA